MKLPKSPYAIQNFDESFYRDKPDKLFFKRSKMLIV